MIDEHGYSPFWRLGKRFFSMDFSRADFLCGTGAKAFIAELMPKHPIYTHFYPVKPTIIGQVHPQTAPARAVLEKKGFATVTIDIFDGGPTPECDIDRACAIRKSRLVEVAEGQHAQGDFPACLVANEKLSPFPRGAGAYRSSDRAFDFNRRTTGCPQMPRRDRVSSGAPVRRGENSMTLWINGDWVRAGALREA